MSTPYFSVCIPQHNRTDFLLKAVESLSVQTYRDFEICISDDNSTDGRQDDVRGALECTGVPHVFRVREKNGRYDANLRSAIGLARGTFCFILCNDDMLASDQALERLHALMQQHGPCGVAVTDFEDFATGRRANRIRLTGNRGSGAGIAIHHFRNFSYVSGLTLDRALAQEFATERWDGSEMYQTYIGCRIIAGGCNLLEVAEPLIRKDVLIPDQAVDSYATRPRIYPCPIQERPIPLVKLGTVVADAIATDSRSPNRKRKNATILLQLLLFPYPFWLLEFRRVQSWNYAAGIALAMRPSRIGNGMELGGMYSWLIKALYLGVTLLGLSAPRRSFELLRPVLYRWAKRASSR